MSFPPEITPGTLRKLIARRELYSYKSGPHRLLPPIDIAPPQGYLELTSYQLFVQNLFNPRTPYRGLHLAWSTGSGKTIGSAACTVPFIKIYKQIYAAAIADRGGGRTAREIVQNADYRTPSVFIIGFANTRAAFTRDLLRYSYFGFITDSEQEELRAREALAASGSIADIKRYNEYLFRLRRKITDKQKGGFYKFLGYQELVNRLFHSESISLVEIEAEAAELARKDQDASIVTVMQKYIDEGKVAVNNELLIMMENSILICDEFHETYNALTLNNYGVAIRYLIDKVPTLRYITVSATPISNSPTEAVDFANFFGANLRKSDVFTPGGELRPGGLELIGKAMFGKISVVFDKDERFFPRRIITGDDLYIPREVCGFSAGDILPYLKFIRCDMSELHYEVLRDYAAASDAPIDDVKIPIDGDTILDMAFPSDSTDDPSSHFRTQRVYDMLRKAPSSWKGTTGIALREKSDSTVITGSFLRGENLAKYSTKYARMIKDIVESYRNGPQKIMIYHDRIEMSGVLLIQEILRENGILAIGDIPSPSSICVLCGLRMDQHREDISGETTDVDIGQDHQFTPVYAFAIHSKIDEVTQREGLAKYNHPSNANGSSLSIIIGGRIIQYGYDFKAIRKLLIMRVPDSLFGMIQIFGRAVRMNSHIDLPADQRSVEISLYISTYDKILTPEMRRYICRTRNHIISQGIIREWSKNSVDAAINYEINISRAMRANYFQSSGTSPAPVLENWYYEPAVDIASNGVELTDTTYYAHGRYASMVKSVIIMIKYAMTMRRVWKRLDLRQWVNKPGISTQFDPALITDEIFELAMAYLLARQNMVIKKDAANVATNIYSNSRIVQIGSHKCNIAAIGDFYVAIPVTTITTDNNIITGEPIIDAESYMRQPMPRRGMTFNLAVVESEQDTILQAVLPKLAGMESPIAFLTAIRSDHQQQIVHRYIQHSGVPGLDMRPIIKLLQDIGALITGKQVRTYSAISSIFGAPAADDAIVGYLSGTIIKLYNGSRWITTGKTSMNRKIDYRENSIIVGLLETAGDVTKLKLRGSVESIRRSITVMKKSSRRSTKSHTTADTRTVERGLVCETRSKEKLAQISRKLGIAPGDKIKNMCVGILARLVELEIIERRAKTKTKYLYGWWDDPVDIVAAL